MKGTIIIAKYQEDITWCDKLKNDYLVKVITKGIDMPNVGREASSYLKFIVDNYDSLNGWYIFLQGNPFAHCPTLLEDLNMLEVKSLGKEVLVCNLDGSPHHPGLNIEAFCNNINLSVPKELVFVPGAQFITTADIIKSYTKEYWKELYNISLTNHGTAWILERLWKYLLVKND